MGRIQGDLKERTFGFAKSIVNLYDGLPNNGKGWEIGRQLIRSGTSVGSNVWEADHALTERDFAHGCNIARKEASETCFWLRLCRECMLLEGESATQAYQEADELTRILSSVVKATQHFLEKS